MPRRRPRIVPPSRLALAGLAGLALPTVLAIPACIPTWPERTTASGDDDAGTLPPLPPEPPPPVPGSTGPDDGDGGDGPPSSTGGDGSDEGGGETGEPPTGDLPIPTDPSSAQLRIWQVLADPAGKDGGPDSPEFVVVHNPGPGPASLVGVRLEATSWSAVEFDLLDLGFTSLDTDQSLVIFRFSDPQPTPIVGLPAVVVSGSGGLRNADGHVVLVGSNGDALDLLVYGGPSDDPLAAGWSGAPAPDPGSDEAFCRVDASALGAGAWISCPPVPGPAGPNALGPLRIVEVLAGGPGDAGQEKTHEFIELINASASDVELTDWRIEIDGGVEDLELIAGPGGCSPEPCLPPHGRLLLVHDVYAGASANAGLAITDDGRLGTAGLDDTSTLRLLRPDGQPASTHRAWPDPGEVPRPGHLNESLQRSSPEAIDDPAAWSITTPSPGS